MVNWSPRSDPMFKGLDINFSDEAASTVIHVRGQISARMCDVGCVFDKLGVDVISCSTMPSSSSCDMTLVVVDSYESQPLDAELKQSVTEGLRRVFSTHSQQGSPSSGGPVQLSQPAGNMNSSSSLQPPAGGPGQELQQHAPPPLGMQAGSRSTSIDACRADSASESIPVSKAPSSQLNTSDAPLPERLYGTQQRQASWGGVSAAPLPLSLVQSPAARPSEGPLNAWAGSPRSSLQGQQQQQQGQQQDQQHSVRFSPECSVSTLPPAAELSLQRTGSGRPLKPALKIDIPCDSDSSSTRWQFDNSNNPSSRQSEHPHDVATGLSISVRGSRPKQQQQQQQQQQGCVQAHDLAQRLRELGMLRPRVNDAGGDWDDDECDTQPSISCRSGGSSSSAAAPGGGSPPVNCNWQPVKGPCSLLQAKSCGNLLQVASKQQVACMQRVSDAGPGPSRAVEGMLDCFGTSRTSLDTGLEQQQGDSSRSLGSIDQDFQGSGRRAPPMSPAPGAAAAGGGSGGRRRRPPPRTPSRIILSPVGVDGSVDPAGQPKLFVSIPKSGEERRGKRVTGSSGTQSLAATPRVPFTPLSGIAAHTPASASARGGHALKQLSSSLVGRKAAPLSPTSAAAAAAATDNMPYNVAVAAAQLLGGSNPREAAVATAVVAAAAEKGDSSTPLPSPLHVSPATAARRFSDDGMQLASPRVSRTSPCFQHPPPTPVHPAVAAAAAAAITMRAAADAAILSQAQEDLPSDNDNDDEPLQLLPACTSPQRSSFQLVGSPEAPVPSTSPAAAAAVIGDAIPECSEEDEAAQDSEGSSGSEEWWCGELTGLSVRDIMTGPVKAVAADADTVLALQMMKQEKLPGMLVDTGPGHQPGLLTRTDFFKRRRGSRKRSHKPCVRDIMGPVLVVDVGMSIEACAQAMQEAGVRHAAVRDESAAAAAGSGDDSQPSGPMSAFVGLVSEAAILHCLGLYPNDAGEGGEELLEDGVLGMPHALRLRSGLDSSFDSSGGGTDTPLSSRSRVATPLLDHSARDGGGAQQQEQQDHTLQQELSLQSSGQQSRQASLVKLPDIVLLREGLGGHGSSAASSLCSPRPGMSAAAADSSRKSAAGGISEDGGANRSGSFVLVGAGSDGSSTALPDSTAPAGVAGPPDALARYKHAAALWEVDLSDFEMIRRIGEGSFGEVMVANYRGTKVAVKRLRVLDLDDTVAPIEQYAQGVGSGSSTQSSSGGEYGGANGRAMGASQAAFRQFFEREIAILASIRHPNVVNFIGACHKPGQRCLVTEFCARGSLDQVLHKSGVALDLSKRIEFAMDIARGMACLHAQRPIIIHRDLKTANLLVSARYEIKVADFGLSRIKDASHLQVSRAGLEGTIEYCAPEVLRGEPYTERCDVYSFGVVLWELLLRQRPYSDTEVPVFLLMVNIGNGSLSLPPVPVEAATPGLVELVNRCLAFSAADRPEFREVLALLETEYRALRARQPPRPQQQQQQLPMHQQLQAGAVVRCDSASSLAVHQQCPRITGDSPDPGGTPLVQSPAGTLGATGHVPPALTPAGSFGLVVRPGPVPAGAVLSGTGEQEGQQYLQQMGWHSQQPQQQPQPQQRHRLSQQDSLAPLHTAPSGGSAGGAAAAAAQPAASSFAFQNIQQVPAVTPQLHAAAQQQQYQVQYNAQQQVFSVPLPQLQLQHSQHVYVPPAPNSPRHQQPQQFAVPVVPQLRVMSAVPSVNIGNMQAQLQQQQQQLGPQFQQHTGLGGPSAGPTGGSSVKPPRHKTQLSRARSMPVPQSAWELDEDEFESDGRGAEECIQEECTPQDLLLFAEDSFGGVSNCSLTAYSPCPSGQLCMLVEPASSTFGSSSAAGMMPYQQPQQQVLLTPGGQQVAVQQVPMQPVLIQQPGGQLQQAYIQQQPYTALQPVAPQQPQQQQQSQARVLQRTALGTPSPTPGVLGRAGTPLSSSPSPGLNHLAIMAAAGAAAAHARREGSASGAASPRCHTSSGLHVVGGHSRSSSHGCSQEMPSLHLLQLSDMHNSRPASPQRGASGPGAGRLSSEGGGAVPGGASGGPVHHPAWQTPLQGPSAAVVNAGGAAMVTPVLIQRLDSLHRSGSSGCSPRCLHRSSSPGLQPEHSGQLLGLLVPGYCSGPASGPNSPRSHSPHGGAPLCHPTPAVVAAVHHLHRPGSSRLAVAGSYELPPGAGAASTAAGSTTPLDGHQTPMAGAGAAGSGGAAYAVDAGQPGYGVGVPVHAPAAHVYHHQFGQPHPPMLQPSSRRAPSLLRIDSNSRDRAVSPFAIASGAVTVEDRTGSSTGAYGATAAAAAASGPIAAAPAGTCSRTLSPFAAASSNGSSLEDVASRGNSNDVVHPAAAAGAPSAAGSGLLATRPAFGGSSSSSTASPARYVSPFAAAAGRQDDEDTDAVFDTRAERSSRSGSPAPGTSKQVLQVSSIKASAAAGPDAAPAAAEAAVLTPPSSSQRLASPFALMQQQASPSN